MDHRKYQPSYFMPPGNCRKWVARQHITAPPVWCSVDMRDGNQSLVTPMTLQEKIIFYKMLLQVGFKEIEVGFPASSPTEYTFLRTLIDDGLIPDDVSIQVLTQSREHIIRKTFEACAGAPNAIIHFYNSVSVAQRQQVFRKSREEIKQLAIDGARLVKKLAREYPGKFRFEYSPESFTGAEPEYALEVCNAVLEELEPSADNNVIINLPVTVEMSLPHVYASQVEYMSDNLICREHVTLSLHPHNDRGTAVADTELALLAGAQRVEGTLFGNGERTGNVDIVTVAMNMYSHGVDPKLDFSDMPSLVATYEKCTGMTVPPRTPYAGALVFAAFSGGHQDAIAKGIKFRKDNSLDTWSIPYLPVDPTDINRSYDGDVIRVNSQSGKGGIGYVLEQNYGYVLPKPMQEHFSYRCKEISDKKHVELKPDDMLVILENTYFPGDQRKFNIAQLDFVKDGEDMVAKVRFVVNNCAHDAVTARGNGPLDAVSNAIKQFTGRKYLLDVYSEHSLRGRGSGSRAAAYIGLKSPEGKMFWGAATNTSIIRAGVDALVCAFDNLLADAENTV